MSPKRIVNAFTASNEPKNLRMDWMLLGLGASVAPPGSLIPRELDDEKSMGANALEFWETLAAAAAGTPRWDSPLPSCPGSMGGGRSLQKAPEYSNSANSTEYLTGTVGSNTWSVQYESV